MNENDASVSRGQHDRDLSPHWLKGAPIQNYGDLLSELLIDRLFDVTPPITLRVIGSCLADEFFPTDPSGDTKIVFWGCGARDARGLSAGARERALITSVRGPLTRSVLRLGSGVPIGDSALLLPLLHCRSAEAAARQEPVIIPHFHDDRDDDALSRMSGCPKVLRPNLPNSMAALVGFIDAVCDASFVLTASLHGAVTAAAYGVPFAFWDSGNIDLPFKWEDFAASLQIPCAFLSRLVEAEAWYAQQAAPTLKLPLLWPILAAAPAPVRPELLIEAVRYDIRRSGPQALDMATIPRGNAQVLHDLSSLFHEERRLHDEVAGAVDVAFPNDGAAPGRQDQNEAHGPDAVDRIMSAGVKYKKLNASVADLQDSVVRLRGEIDNLRAQNGRLSQFELRKLESFLDREKQHTRALERKLIAHATSLDSAQADPSSSEAENMARQVQALQVQLRAVEADRNAMSRSLVWRVGSRVRAISFQHPRASTSLRQVVKLGWWLVSLRLTSKLRQRRQLQRDVALLGNTPLFDSGWYSKQVSPSLSSDIDPLMHFLWTGAQNGLKPHCLFDTAFYMSQLPVGSTVNPLVHYLTSPERHDPHPLFDSRYYVSQLEEPLPPTITPFEHFVTQGAAAKGPNPIFDSAAYAYEYPEAADYPAGAFAHYVELGEAAGLCPHPLFDPAWYAERHPGHAGLGPLADYLRHGRSVGLACSASMQALGPTVASIPFRLEFPAIENPGVSIIIPTFGHLYETLRCLLAVMVHTGDVRYEVIVADDRPSAPISHLVVGANLRVHRNTENLGFLRSCNAAAKRARGQMLVFLNNDTLVGLDWLRPMLELVDTDRRVGMVGCKLLNGDGTLQEAGGIIHSNGWGFPYGNGDDPSLGTYNYVREVDVVTGACFLVRRDLFDRLGGFDDRYAPAFYEEFDLATAIRDLGFKILYQPASVVVHHGSASYGREQRDRQSKINHAKFCSKWRVLLANQPVEGDPLFLAKERPSARGIILVIDDKVPEYDRHAGAVTLFQYLQLMCELGLKVVFHPHDCQPLQPYTDALQRRGIEVLHAPETLSNWLRKNGRHIDYVWTARPYVTVPILDSIKRFTGAPILYYTHDLHYLREMRRYEVDGSVWALEESQRLKPMELGIFSTVDRVMTPSSEEARIISAEVPDAHVTVVPPYLFSDLAVDVDQLDFHGKTDIVFVGGFDHTPNVDAAIWLVTEIMPIVWASRPDVRALIIGNAPPPEVEALAGDRVDVTGFVPLLEPYYSKARMSVSPLRYGAGVKGKIVGALQAGVPVVTTSCGNEGIQLRHGEEALIADTADEIAAAIGSLLENDELCLRLATAGGKVVRTRFSAARARNVLLKLLGDDLCPVCGTRPRNPRIDPHSDWRECFSCMTCSALNRTAALAEVLVKPYYKQRVASLREALPLLDGLRIHEFGLAGPVNAELSKLSRFSCSELFDHVPPGSGAPDEVAWHDLQTLAFQDESIDLLISQDVMEHSPDPEVTFRELFRVLRPGAKHVFTIPFSPAAPSTVQRAVIENGALQHLLPAEYHGDPSRSRAALVFSEFGSDLIKMLSQIGFAVTLHDVGDPTQSTRRVLVFETTK